MSHWFAGSFGSLMLKEMNLLMVLLSSLFFIVILLRKDTHIHRNEKEAGKNVANKINEIVEKRKKKQKPKKKLFSKTQSRPTDG